MNTSSISTKMMSPEGGNGCTAEVTRERVSVVRELLQAILMHSNPTSGRSFLHGEALSSGDSHIELLLKSILLSRLHQIEQLHKIHSSDHKAGEFACNLEEQILTLPDKESGYTPLHWAILRGDLASILLLVRHCLTATHEHDSLSRRLSKRPMDVLQGYGTNVSVMLAKLIAARDQEGLTPSDLLAIQQRSELAACRQALLSISSQISSVSTGRQDNTWLKASGLHLTDADETDEASDTLRDTIHLETEATESSLLDCKRNLSEYGCEVLTFGSAHICASGVSTSASCSSSGTTLNARPIVGAATSRPQRVQAFGQERVGRMGGAVSVSAASHHTLVLTRNGHVYAFGLGKGGRLGTGDESHCALPTRVVGLSHHKVVWISAAESHSLCVTKTGIVFAWGSNRYGQLGLTLDDCSTRSVPRRIDNLKNTQCVAVAAGAKHSVALSRIGEVFVWGDNTAGQLGVSRRNGTHRVHRVEALWGTSPPKVAMSICASEKTTLVLTLPWGRTGVPVNSIYTWGHGSHVPSKIQLNPSVETRNRLVNPVSIACARFHNVVVSSDGLVYTWGLHAESLGTPVSARKGTAMAVPQLVQGMLPHNGGGVVVGVSASENHTAVITDTGALYTWGAAYGEDVLGHEGIRWQPDPKRVPGIHRAVSVSAAKEHTVLLVGATFSRSPHPRSDFVPSLESLAAGIVAHHVDLFNVIPVLITAERIHSPFLVEHCDNFIRRNLDAVLDFGQRSVMNVYLEEQIAKMSPRGEMSQDGHIHPLLFDIALAGAENKKKQSLECTSSCGVHQWLEACTGLRDKASTKYFERHHKLSRAFILGDTSCSMRLLCQPPQNSTRGISGNGKNDRSCSGQCRKVTSEINLSTKSSTLAKFDALNKETRVPRKRLGQISKIEKAAAGMQSLTPEQQEKIARRSELEADLIALQPSLKQISSHLTETRMVEKKVQSDSHIKQAEEKKKIKNDNTISLFRCEVCSITCPDLQNLEFHLNGRKHRNRVAHLAFKDEEQASKAVINECRRRQILGTEGGGGDRKHFSSRPWQSQNGKAMTSLPKYQLPPPPHPFSGSLSPVGCGEKKSLQKIMEEESRLRAASSKESTKIPKIGTARPSKTFKSLPRSVPPIIQSVGSPCSRKSAPRALPTATVRTPISVSMVQCSATSYSPPNSSPKALYSLGDFWSPKKAAPRPVIPAVACWASPRSIPSNSAVITPPSQSLKDIQQQEEDLKTKQVPSCGENGRWYIERRERADSLTEIQAKEARENEFRRFVEEQREIEKIMMHELVTSKEADNKNPARKRIHSKGKRR
jgi:alpha-tubulin suppressor-like RCC1 family protein